MKLYSKAQVVFSTVIGMAVAASLTTLFVTLATSNKSNKQSKTENTAQTSQIEKNIDSETAITQKEEEPFVLQQEEAPSPEKLELQAVSTDLTYTQDEIQNISVYAKCSPAVVNINTQVTGVNWFLEPIVQDGGSGSGSIIDKRGYVLTNVHVIKGASKIYVSLSDGTQYEAKVIGQDADSDLAVIKFDPPEGTNLTTISFGDSTSLKVGQKVIAIGNPFGFERTMTTGIVSALGRPIKDSSTNRIIRNMIQTDSAINPGNSGGPLLDTNGKMIGINTMIYSSSGNSAGIGFSVPASTMK